MHKFKKQMENVQTTQVAPLTSEKLTSIEAAILAKNAEIKAAFLADADEATLEALNLEKFKLTADKKAEIANIQRANVEAAKIAARNARLAIRANFEAAVIADYILQADKKADAESKAQSSEALAKQRESLDNELLGGKAVSVSVKAVKADGTTSGNGGAKKAEIVAMYVAELASGKNHTEAMAAVVAAGTPRGSAWAPIDNYRKENGLK